MKDALARAAAPVAFDPADEETLPVESVKPPTIVGRGIDSFVVPADNDRSTLLGNRYLCRGDGMVIVSSSGMGKSALSIQAAVTWCFGLPFMGIKPNGKLRSLIIQSEDSDGDIAEVWASICHKMNLTPEQRQFASEDVIIVSDRVNRGPAFMAELKRQVAASKFDLVWINPLAAFISGDATTQEATAEFLRAGLNGINADSAFGYIIVQHTTKPATGKDRSDRKWFEVMYDMAGSYDIIGWARCIMSLRPTDTMGEFNLVLAKRGSRAGVTKCVPHGMGYRHEPTNTIPLKHSNERMPIPGQTREMSVIFWEAREEVSGEEKAPEKPAGRPRKNSITDFIGIFPVGSKFALGVNDLLREALKIRHIAKPTLYSIIDEGMQKQIIVCDSSNPRCPTYYVRPPAVDLADEEQTVFEP